MHPETRKVKKMHLGSKPGEANCRKNAPKRNFQNAPGEQKSKKNAEKKHPGTQKAPGRKLVFLGAFILHLFCIFSAFFLHLLGCMLGVFVHFEYWRPMGNFPYAEHYNTIPKIAMPWSLHTLFKGKTIFVA